MAIYVTTRGERINSNLTHREAAAICRRIPTECADYSFAQSLCGMVERGRPLSDRQLPYLHKFALEQIDREEVYCQQEGQPAATVDSEFWRNLKPHLLNYDIPSNRPDILNPSARLRRIGIRLTLSCWLMAEGDLPYTMLNEMTAPRAFPVLDRDGVQVLDEEGQPRYRNRRGAKWHVVPFDPAAAESLVRMATEALQHEIRDAVIRATETAQSASERIEQAEGDPTKAQKRYEQDMAKINETLQKTLDDLQCAAQRFGIDLGIINADRARETASDLKAAMETRCRLYAEAGRRVRLSGRGDAGAIAEAISRDSMSPLVLADWLQENEEEELGEALRASFQNG